MRNLLAGLLLCLCLSGNAQTDYSFVYDGDIFLARGIALYDEGKYPEAIREFEKIAPNDPLFYTAQYEKALSLHSAEDPGTGAFYELALQKGYMEEAPDFYMLYGNFLSDAKEYDKAEKIFRESEKKFPNSSPLYYNMGLLYLRKEQRQLSVEMLQKAITINPNHTGSHYMLGLIAMEEGRAVEGSLALLAFLTLTSEGVAAQNAIAKLNAKFSENYLEKSEVVFSKTGDNFEEIDVILRNSLPLKSAYKVQSAFDDVIIRQVQAIVEYAATHKVEGGFFETTYIPFLADIARKKQFEGFSYHILLPVQDKLGKKFSSQSKKLKAFTDGYLGNELWSVFARRTVDLFGKQEEVVVYLKDGKPQILGKQVNGKSEGKYKILGENGNMVSELNFVSDNLDGLQKYYDNKGRLYEETTMSADKRNGKRTRYNDDGSLSLVENYKDDVLQGLSTSYYIKGGKACEGNFVVGERDGKFVCYFENGVISSETEYSKGKMNGKNTTYDAAGNMISQHFYNMDKLEGKAVEYYDGKILKSEGTYKDGNLTTPYRSYFVNGKTEEEAVWANGKPLSSVTYMPTGKKSLETTFKDGVAESHTYYNPDGDPFFQEYYKSNGIKSVKQYVAGSDKAVETAISTGGYKMKGLTGNTIVEGRYEKGKQTGEWKFYYLTGEPSRVDNYKGGEKQGLSTAYNQDKSISGITNYVNDSIKGVREYFRNGKLTGRFHYSYGLRNGPGTSYYNDGKIESDAYYIGDQATSVGHDYWQSGALKFRTVYEAQSAVRIESYLPNGQKENEMLRSGVTGRITTSYFGGTEIHQYDLTNGVLNGIYLVKSSKGEVLYDGNYKNGRLHGKYRRLVPGGALAMEGEYYLGRLHGPVTYYDLAGNKRLQEENLMGDNYGKSVRFYHNKGKYSESDMVGDEREGESRYYNMKGDLVLILGFVKSELRYYIPLGADGKPGQKVMVENQTAKIVSKYPNGKPAYEVTYKKGMVDGRIAVYNNEGKPEYTVEYTNDRLNGPRTEYYANGNIYKKENFVHDSNEGLQEFFTADGKPLVSAEYKNDQMYGLFKLYTNGTNTQTYRFDSNELVEVVK